MKRARLLELYDSLALLLDFIFVFSVPFMFKEELNLMLKVIGLLAKVRWVLG